MAGCTWKRSTCRFTRYPCGSECASGVDALPNVVLFWESYHLVTSAFLQLFKADFGVVIYCDDLHWFNEGMRSTKSLALVVADVILASYAPVFGQFYPAVAAAKRVVWVPHAASPEFMLPLNESAANVILLSGMINDYYPLRKRMRTLGEFEEFQIVEHPHPGYQCNHDHKSSGSVGAGYAPDQRLAGRFHGCE